MELFLNGYIDKDYNGHPSLKGTKDERYGKSIPDAIQKKFNCINLDKGLGENITTISNCNLSIYYAEDICTFEEAQEALLNKLYGDMFVHTTYVGYSEYTITGLDLEDFVIGGHDLEQEFNSHMGEYCWIHITD